LACIFCFVGAISGQTYGYAGNVSASVDRNTFKFREVTLGAVNFPVIFQLGYYISIALDFDASSAVGDVIGGAAYAGASIFPTSTLAYFEASASWDPALISTSQDWSQLNVSTSAGFISAVYLALVEKDSNGDVVNIVLLNSLVWTTTFGTDGTGLYWAIFKGVPLGGSWSITFTHFASSRLGLVNTAAKPGITPRNLETVITITSYPYATTTNTLSLDIGVGTGNVQASGTGQLVSGTGISATYYNLVASAHADGKVTPVSISGWVTGDLTYSTGGNTNLQTQLQAKFGASFDIRNVTVTFTAGASSIEWDPQLGNGPAPGIASGLAPGLAMLLPLILLFSKLF